MLIATYPRYFVSPWLTSHSEVESNTIVNIIHREYTKMNGRLRPKGEMHLSDHVPSMGTNIKHSNGPRKVNIFISLNTISTSFISRFWDMTIW